MATRTRAHHVEDYTDDVRDSGTPRDQRRLRTRERIIQAAAHRFAESGLKGGRLEDIAADVGLTRGGVLRHFGSKENLMFEVHKMVAMSLTPYLSAPEEVLEQGFVATLRYWHVGLVRCVRERLEEHRLILLGWSSTDFDLQERITRFWLAEDPEGTLEFVEFGQRRGEVRRDLDPYVVAAVIDWISEGLTRSVMARELDRAGLFLRRDASHQELDPVVDTIIEMLRGTILTAGPSPAEA